MNELILLLCYSGAVGAVGGFLLCLELTRWDDRRRARKLASKRAPPQIVKSVVKLGKSFERAFYGREKSDLN